MTWQAAPFRRRLGRGENRPWPGGCTEGGSRWSGSWTARSHLLGSSEESSESAGYSPLFRAPSGALTEDGIDLATLAYGTTLRDWVTSPTHRHDQTRGMDHLRRHQAGAIGLPPQPVGTPHRRDAPIARMAHRVLTFNS